MTFWLYQPSQFFKKSTILPFKSQDFGDLLNFLTLFLCSFFVFIKSKGLLNERIQKYFIIALSVIILLSLLGSKSGEDTEMIEGIEVPKYSDYKYSLSVD